MFHEENSLIDNDLDALSDSECTKDIEKSKIPNDNRESISEIIKFNKNQEISHNTENICFISFGITPVHESEYSRCADNLNKEREMFEAYKKRYKLQQNSNLENR